MTSPTSHDLPNWNYFLAQFTNKSLFWHSILKSYSSFPRPPLPNSRIYLSSFPIIWTPPPPPVSEKLPEMRNYPPPPPSIRGFSKLYMPPPPPLVNFWHLNCYDCYSVINVNSSIFFHTGGCFENLVALFWVSQENAFKTGPFLDFLRKILLRQMTQNYPLSQENENGNVAPHGSKWGVGGGGGIHVH